MIRISLPDLQRRPESDYASGFTCDACHKGTSMALFHCDVCNFDLCRPCGMSAIGRSQCPVGHPLIRFTMDDFVACDKRNPERSCSVCKQTDTHLFMMVCLSCDYKLCPTCYTDQIVCFHFVPHSAIFFFFFVVVVTIILFLFFFPFRSFNQSFLIRLVVILNLLRFHLI